MQSRDTTSLSADKQKEQALDLLRCN